MGNQVFSIIVVCGMDGVWIQVGEFVEGKVRICGWGVVDDQGIAGQLCLHCGHQEKFFSSSQKMSRFPHHIPPEFYADQEDWDTDPTPTLTHTATPTATTLTPTPTTPPKPHTREPSSNSALSPTHPRRSIPTPPAHHQQKMVQINAFQISSKYPLYSPSEISAFHQQFSMFDKEGKGILFLLPFIPFPFNI